MIARKRCPIRTPTNHQLLGENSFFRISVVPKQIPQIDSRLWTWEKTYQTLTSRGKRESLRNRDRVNFHRLFCIRLRCLLVRHFALIELNCHESSRIVANCSAFSIIDDVDDPIICACLNVSRSVRVCVWIGALFSFGFICHCLPLWTAAIHWWTESESRPPIHLHTSISRRDRVCDINRFLYNFKTGSFIRNRYWCAYVFCIGRCSSHHQGGRQPRSTIYFIINRKTDYSHLLCNSMTKIVSNININSSSPFIHHLWSRLKIK